MKYVRLNRALALAVFLWLAGSSWAGPPRGVPRPGIAASGTVLPAWGVGVQPQRYYYPQQFFYVPYQPPILVVSPYGPSYYLPPAVVVTSPFFCVLDNHGFVSRIALIDHLAGSHKIPLHAAATICPDDTASCIFPAY